MFSSVKFDLLGLLVVLALAVPNLLAQAAERVSGALRMPSVLAILSYEPEFPTSKDILQGLNDSFPADRFALKIHYLRSKEVPGPLHAALFRDILADELATKGVPDIVLTFDDNALHFAQDARAALFPGKPVVFAGVNDVDFARAAHRQPGVTGVIEAISPGETLQLIQQLDPQIRRLRVVVDTTETSQADLRTLLATQPKIKLDVLNVSGIPESSFAAALRENDPTLAYLLLGAYNGYLGRTYTFPETLALIQANAQRPVFHLWKHGVGQGLVGGRVVSQYEQARASSQLALRILAGDRTENLPVVEHSPNIDLLDWNELARFKLEAAVLPKDVTILNRPPSLFESHPNLFWGVALAGVAAAGIIGVLLVMMIYRDKVSRNLARHIGFLNTIINAVESPIYLKDREGRYLMANPGFTRLAGYDEADLQGKRLSDIGLAEVAEAIEAMDEKAIQTGILQTTEMSMVFGGEQRVVRLAKIALLDPEGRSVILGTIHDLTADRRLEENLRSSNERLEAMVVERTHELELANSILAQLAETDRLTALANRRKLELVLAEELARMERYDTQFAVIMLDIDHFKLVNDNYGHDEGDKVLIGVAVLLGNHCRITDLAGRWGGEEMLVICRNADADAAGMLAEKLRAAIEQTALSLKRQITASFGVAMAQEGDTIADLLKRADECLYTAKNAGRNRVEPPVSVKSSESTSV